MKTKGPIGPRGAGLTRRCVGVSVSCRCFLSCFLCVCLSVYPRLARFPSTTPSSRLCVHLEQAHFCPTSRLAFSPIPFSPSIHPHVNRPINKKQAMDPTSDPQAAAAMQAFIQEENQKAAVQQIIAKLTNVCWDKCMSSKPGTKLSNWESECVSNCAQRFLDASMLIVQRMQQQR